MRTVPPALSTPMVRRRFLGLAGTAALGSVALAACGGPSTSTASSSPVAEKIDYSGVTPAKAITWWSNNPGSSQDVSQQIIDAFHASQNDIRVTLVTAGANYEEVAQKFQTAQTGGTLPDLVVFSDVWWFRYYMQRSIVPWDSLIAAVGIDTSDYRDQLLADYSYDGAQWAIPWARSTPLFYYNKTHWSAAGLPDRAPKTWDELAEWAPKVQAANSGLQHGFQLPALDGYAGWSFQNNLWGQGGGWSTDYTLTCDSTESVKALQFLQDAVYSGGWAGVASKDSANDLSAGAVSSTIASTGSLVGILKTAIFDVGAGFLPGGPVSTSPVCPTGGAGVGIPAGVPKENQLAAAMFVKFLTSPKNTVAFSAATGYLPLRKSADTTTLTAKAPQIATAISQLDHTRTQDRARVFFPGGDQEMAKTCANILTQQANVQSEMDSLKSTLTTIYQRDVKPHV